MTKRKTSVTRGVEAGCYVCHRGAGEWGGKNAQGVAARHHDATGHATWVRVDMEIYYGEQLPDDLQRELFSNDEET